MPVGTTCFDVIKKLLTVYFVKACYFTINQNSILLLADSILLANNDSIHCSFNSYLNEGREINTASLIIHKYQLSTHQLCLHSSDYAGCLWYSNGLPFPSIILFAIFRRFLEALSSLLWIVLQFSFLQRNNPHRR